MAKRSQNDIYSLPLLWFVLICGKMLIFWLFILRKELLWIFDGYGTLWMCRTKKGKFCFFPAYPTFSLSFCTKGVKQTIPNPDDVVPYCNSNASSALSSFLMQFLFMLPLYYQPKAYNEHYPVPSLWLVLRSAIICESCKATTFRILET